MKNRNDRFEHPEMKKAFFLRLLEREHENVLTEREKQILHLWKENRISEIDDNEILAASERIWNRLEERSETATYPSYKQSGKRNRLSANLYRYAAVAAIFVLGMVSTVVYFMDNKQVTVQQSGWVTITTGAKEIKTITLPDGSKVSLNNASTFAYRASEFNKTQREVWLKEGEAFFEVTPNPKKPFMVNYQEMQTVVLGTSFNIKAYRAVGENSVTVVTGRVLVKKDNKEIGILTPDRRLAFSTNTQASKISATDAKKSLGWMQGDLNFVDAPYAEIALRLKQKFDVETKLQEVTEDEIRLTAKFEDNDPLEKIVKAIAWANDIRYKVDGKDVLFYKSQTPATK